jgi:DNA-binding Lrp family transcriptional regulator
MIMTKEERIIELLEAVVKAQLSPIINQELKDKKKRMLYGLTGTASINVIKSKIGLSAGSVSAIWQKWEQLGLIKKVGKSYKKII